MTADEAKRVAVQTLPKLEAHAHLTGSLPISCVEELIRKKVAEDPIRNGFLSAFKVPTTLERIEEYVSDSRTG